MWEGVAVLNSQKNFEDSLKEGWYLTTLLINGLVVAKQHIRITFCPVIFASIDFRVALGLIFVSI